MGPAPMALQRRSLAVVRTAREERMTVDLQSVGASAEATQDYTWQDTALYALSLGAGPDDLKYVRDKPAPEVLPTFGVLPAFDPAFEVLRKTGADLVQLLHTAQHTEQLAPFPPSGTMHTRATLRGLWDMKIGATALVDTETRVDGKTHCRTTWELLLRGEGGFGGERPPSRLRTRAPKDVAPLFSERVPTLPTQALLYRLNGDVNPIHMDPQVAAEAGFDRPILHGLCTYGIAGRVALKHLAGNDAARFQSLAVRFSKVVFPGDTLIVQGYALPEPGQVALTVTVEETGAEAISNALFRYRA